MSTLLTIIENLPSITLHNGEILYRFSDLEVQLNLSVDNTIRVDSMSLTPSYYQDDKRIEFYYYAFNIRILDFTGDRTKNTPEFATISDETKFLYKECNINIPAENSAISIQRLKKYLIFLKEQPDIVSSVLRFFSSYSEKNLMFTLFLESN